MRGGYEKVLASTTRHTAIVVSVVALLCLLALSRLPFLGGEFLPEFREGHFVLQVNAAPGTSLPETLRIGKQISDKLLEDKRIQTVDDLLSYIESKKAGQVVTLTVLRQGKPVQIPVKLTTSSPA